MLHILHRSRAVFLDNVSLWHGGSYLENALIYCTIKNLFLFAVQLSTNLRPTEWNKRLFIHKTDNKIRAIARCNRPIWEKSTFLIRMRPLAALSLAIRCFTETALFTVFGWHTEEFDSVCRRIFVWLVVFVVCVRVSHVCLISKQSVYSA
jgi:hypothetical protein